MNFQELTPEYAAQILDEELEWGKAARAQLPFSHKDAAFQPRVTIVRHGGQVAIVPILGWRGDDEKKRIMFGLAVVLRAANVEAACVTSDMRWMDLGRVGKALNFAPIDHADPESLKRGQEEWLEYRRVHLAGEMGNLAAHLWSNGIVAAMKSPTLGLQLKRADYIDDGTDRCIFETIEVPQKPIHMNLIPDWWKIPDDAPELVHARANVQFFMRRM